MNTGAPAYGEQERTDSLKITLIKDDFTEADLSGTQYITIFDSSGSEVVARTSSAITTAGAVASFSHSWSSANYSRKEGYKALWELSDGATTHKREQWFAVVRRIFRSTLRDSDITAIHPYITQQNQAASLAQYKLEAWQEIEMICRARIPFRHYNNEDLFPNTPADFASSVLTYPGGFFRNEELRLAHLNLTLSWFFEHNSFGTLDQNQERAKNFRAKAMQDLDLALSRIAFDRDGDGLLDSREEDFDFSSVEISR